MIQACHQSMSNCMDSIKFIYNPVARHEVAPIVTFDQPQKWKAFTIMYNEQQDSKLHNIILRLGGFHTWMSFMVSIDLIMEDSGIGYLWWKIYADSTLNHMVSGETYVRATRGHLQGTIASIQFNSKMFIVIPIQLNVYNT